jgi:drug/metabolite transporter (DMT)-like permease
MACAMVFSGLGILVLPAQHFRFAVSEPAQVRSVWLVLALMGLFSAAGNLLMTSAYRRLSTATGSILTLMVLPLTAVAAVVWFGEPLGVRRAVGGLLILAAGFLAALPRRARRRRLGPLKSPGQPARRRMTISNGPRGRRTNALPWCDSIV